MKFTDGNWLVREGYQIHFPRIVHEVEEEERAVTLYAPCKYIDHRGSTLDGPMLTIKISSPPIENVFRLQTWHFKGERERYPKFEVLDQSNVIDLTETEDTLTFVSGDLTLAISKQDFSLFFKNSLDGLTDIDGKGLAWINGPEDKTYMRGQLRLGVGEYLYGLGGERFTPFVKNGQTVDIWNKDGGTSSEQSYKNIPFYLSSKGYGIFVNHPEQVSFELGSETVSRSQFSVEGGEYLDYYFINGPTPKEVVSRYTELTGKPALPPAWSFGLWLSTSFTTEYNEETVNHFVDGMTEREIPLSVFHFDCFWMKEFEWSNFIWDRRNFPDPEGMLHRLKEKGLKICVWINPYIAQKSPLFEEGKEHGYLLKKSNGDVWQWDLWQAGMGVVDFTNPEACQWFQEKLKALLDMGVDCFKTDFGERIPTDVVYHDGSDPHKMHNYYTYQYNQVVFDLLKQEKGDKEAIVFARSATTGGQKFPVHWGGDCDSTYEAMAESLRGGLSLTSSGFGYWSHDIGGFENTATPDVFKRWTAFGLLSSHSRFHGSSSYRVPWNFDDEAVDVARHFTKLKNSLMPYLYAQAVENNKTGIPVMRSMILEFPDDPLCQTLDRQYMLGDSILVAPIFNDKGIGSFYLPQGTWTHLLTGEKREGGTWIKEHYDYLSLPLFVRQNSILPVGNNETAPAYNYLDNITFRIYSIEDGKNVTRELMDTDGKNIASLTVERKGNILTFATKGINKPYTIDVVGYKTITPELGSEKITVEIV
ncbi:alpha-xylosidase [Gracilibacillus boraciitolerans JCM 21714]|uniref:alpha-D-xyloside xylohydrolase n=1 Tax=Gracilibacillus boraciitolerans JCM 21714 TaxID=1298598 RepID=W4VJS0_9BACI|nr:alpha-xylosidase [Gracilibacillus boraciitolerans]GAE93437.1 alpha-xylosidase [Gracilibacillus boraciitolerans JCM 21714]